MFIYIVTFYYIKIENYISLQYYIVIFKNIQKWITQFRLSPKLLSQSM